MEKTELLDAVDMEILRALQKNARLTTKELAAMVNLSTTPVFERVKRLEQRGYVKGYVAVLDAEKLGRGFVVFCSVKMRRIGREIAEDFARVVRDYLLKIHAPNMKYYQEFVLNILGNIDHLGSLESTFVMDEIKHDFGLHI